MKFALALMAALALSAGPAAATPGGPIVFVSMDDRPVTLQLPVLLGRIAGRSVVTPPHGLLGHYLEPGSPDAIVAWLNARAPRNASAYVLSTDMLVYGGLLASRVPGTTYDDAYYRVRDVIRLRDRRPKAWFAAFGTIMRLAPTGIPAIGPGQPYFASGATWQYLWKYAKLHDPLLPDEQARAEQLRALAGSAFDEYVADRARDLAVDRLWVAKAAAPSSALDLLVLGQDDAGPIGIDVPDRVALEGDIASDNAAQRVAIEPGADELGMALIAHALARSVHWQPRVAVRYSTPGGALAQDPLEYAPVSVAIARLIALCGAVETDVNPEIVLYVRVPATSAVQDDAFVSAMRADETAGRSVALADITFLEGGGNPGYADQGAFARRILADGVARRLDAYASWNTNANTVGTALAEAVAAGVGRRSGRYDALAHKEFTFMRFTDDYAYHVEVRPLLNAQLKAQNIDRMLLLPPSAAAVAQENRTLLWNDAQGILTQLYPGYHIAAMRITLPWDRTFETKIEVGLAPDVAGR
ncbi:MAG: DUF4127 family protein [Candidatus Tyrphobacter sp.]